MSIQHSAFDSSIPVLTEVIDENALAAEPPATPPAGEFEARAMQDWTDAEWAVLEQRLSERILMQLQSRTDFVLEQRVRDAMADVLQHALKSLTAEIRDGLHDTLEKIVARAVAQELTHLKALRK
ncbi:MAG TPA: hypothetical protein VGE60_00420 [Telluria sp.]